MLRVGFAFFEKLLQKPAEEGTCERTPEKILNSCPEREQLVKQIVCGCMRTHTHVQKHTLAYAHVLDHRHSRLHTLACTNADIRSQ